MSLLVRGVLLATSLVFSSALVASEHCEEVNGIVSICNLQSPEDLVLTSRGNILFGEMVEGRGISLLDAKSLLVTPLYQSRGQVSETGWGSPDCTDGPGAEVLIHGLDLLRRRDGRWQLLAVNHGGRESVEFFEFLPGIDPQLHWRGCVIAPDDASFNDVAALPEGGFLVSRMYSRGSSTGLLRALLGMDTGYVYRWTTEIGFTALPGTEAPFPNGIAVSADGKSFFMNAWGGSEVRKYSLPESKLLAVAQIPSPDNSNWASDGRLLVASHHYGWSNLLSGLPNKDGSPVEMPFSIAALDPQTMISETLVELEGPPMGAGTAAVEIDGYLFIGSFTGDRIIRVPLAN